jgi:hypothetical protein
MRFHTSKKSRSRRHQIRLTVCPRSESYKIMWMFFWCTYLWITKKAPSCSQLRYNPQPHRLFGLNRAILSSRCHNSSGASAPAKVNVFLGLLQQEASSKNVFGVRITTEGCNPTTGQIPVEVLKWQFCGKYNVTSKRTTPMFKQPVAIPQLQR